MDEQTLIRRAQQGDSGSFTELLDVHYETIYRIAWKWSGHAANAQDIAQQACIKLANSISQFRFEAAFTSWLYRLVINCAQDWDRSQQRHGYEALTNHEFGTDAAQVEDQIYLLQILEQLDQLGEGMKEAALLVHAEGMNHAQAGEILGVSESTVSWRIHTIRKHVTKREAASGGI